MNIAVLRKDVIVVLTILIAFFGVTYCAKIGGHEAKFTILYSNDVLGETEPCG
jgi:hypothetical protein